MNIWIKEKIGTRINRGASSGLFHYSTDVDGFIIDHIISAYNRNELKIHYKKPDVEAPKSIDVVSELSMIPSVMKRAFGDLSIMFHDGNAYSLGKPALNRGNYVSLNGRIMVPKALVSTSEFITAYENVLRRHVQDTAMRIGISHYGRHDKHEGNNGKSYPDEYAEGEISYRRISSSEYSLMLDLPRFLCKIRGAYYDFKPVRLSCPLKREGPSLYLQDWPRVMNEGYKHPFVYDDGKICYDGIYGYKSDIVAGSRKHNIGSVGFASAIVSVLKRARQVICYGYTADMKAPVNNITKFRSIGHTTRDGARVYAVRNGIDPDTRIFLNDAA